MGWTDLATNPPYPLHEIQAFADSIIAQGLKSVVLIGQGGSTQAPMTITKYHKPDSSLVRFRTLDSDSPVRVRGILSEIDPRTTLFIVSSKSGGTIEPRLALRAVRDALADQISDEEMVQHLVAITDPGSKLEQQAARRAGPRCSPAEPHCGRPLQRHVRVRPAARRARGHQPAGVHAARQRGGARLQRGRH